MAYRTATSVLLLTIALLVAPGAAHAQAPAPHATQYWLSAGAGVGYIGGSDAWLGTTGAATSLGATIQHRAFLASLRWARATDTPSSVWQVGAMAGVGTSPRFPVRGSIAAGLGIAGGSGDGSHMTLPVEVQLGWRLTPSIGFGIAGFAAVTGPSQMLGFTAGFQVGRLW